MSNSNPEILSIINASGFLFQLRVEHEIARTQHEREGRWGVEAREHKWSDDASKEEKFIDLILKGGIGRMVVECKRVTDGQWIFLIPSSKKNLKRARLLWTHVDPILGNTSDWSEFDIEPDSPQSSICIIRGKGEKDTPMLERISSVVMRSVEALADQELSFRITSPSRAPRVYIPVIITSATLSICYMDPKHIELATGKLPDGKFQYESVPLVRFRKSLSTSKSGRIPAESLVEAAAMNERTVFVINAVGLSSALAKWKLNYDPRFAAWPWMLSPTTQSVMGS